MTLFKNVNQNNYIICCLIKCNHIYINICCEKSPNEPFLAFASHLAVLHHLVLHIFKMLWKVCFKKKVVKHTLKMLQSFPLCCSWSSCFWTQVSVFVEACWLQTCKNMTLAFQAYSLSCFLFRHETLPVSLGGQSRPLLSALVPFTDAFVATARSLPACQAINTSLTPLW